ncbi:helix-turn-helix domain-containing protein [Vibrio sp. AK197]
MPHEGSSCAPERCKSYSYDVNQQAQSLTAWDQHYNQHSQGTFFGYLDELKLPRVHLFEEFTNRTLLQQCYVNPNAIWIGFSLQAQRPKVDGQEAQRHQVMVRPAHQAFELLTPEEFQIFGLVVDLSLLQKELVEQDYQQWMSARIMDSEQNADLCWQIAKLIAMSLDAKSVIGARIVNEPHGCLSSLIERSVVDKLSGFYLQQNTPIESAASRRSALQRIYHHIEQTGSYPQSITELCQIGCVSRRTLQYVFEQQLSMTPLSYLRDCRLNEVRRSLIETAHQELAICDVALAHGFYHLGSFHHYYKQLFGETPNQTKHRAQGYRRVFVANNL